MADEMRNEPPTWYVEMGRQALHGLSQQYIGKLEEQREQHGFEWTDLNMAQMAHAAEPKPITAEFVLQRVPYINPAVAESWLNEAAERGALREVDHGYELTDDGRTFLEGLTATVDGVMDELDVLPEEQAARLSELLRREAAACEDCGIDTPAMAVGRAFEPGEDAPTYRQIRRALGDLNAFRDDAHVAAWQELDVPGHAFEAISHVWGENIWGEPVRTPEQAAEKLGFRGFDAEDYAEAFQSAAERGWLEQRDDQWHLTPAGRTMRQRVEAETDRIYFEPWDMDESELDELGELMKKLNRGLEEQAPEQAEAG